MGVDYEVLVPPTVEPVTLSEMKVYLRVDFSDEDSLIQQFITDARRYGEEVTRRSLAPQTLRATVEPTRMPEGRLSGPVVGGDEDIFRLNERVTSIPFGLYGPVFALPQAPAQAVTTVEYQLTPFDVPQWQTLAAQDGAGNPNYTLYTEYDPTRLVLMPMLIASTFRITYTAGYAACPTSITNAIKSLVSFWYDNRQGEEIPDSITQAFVRKRIFTL
jgi:hypothetical protein